VDRSRADPALTAGPAPRPASALVADVALLALALWLLRSFILPATWAIVIALSSWPLYVRFRRLRPFSGRGLLAPLVFTVLLTVLVLGPLTLAVGVVAREAQQWTGQLAATAANGLGPPNWLRAVPLVGPRLAGHWVDAIGAPGGLVAWVERAGSGSVLRWAQSFGQFLAHHALVASVTIAMLFPLLRQGESLGALLPDTVRRRFGNRATEFLAIGTSALRATVHSMLVVGAIDGAAMGVTYAVSGVPSPLGWAAVTGILAMLPFVGYGVIAAVCISLVLRDAPAAALAVAAIGVAVLFASDKILRPMLMDKRTELSFLGALLGSLGGLETFGLVGAFIGPAIVALGKAVCREWLGSGGDAPSPADGPSPG